MMTADPDAPRRRESTEHDIPAEEKGTARGSLVAVGTGIRTVGHLTVETIAWMRRADKVLYVVYDPIAEGAIQNLNPAGAESLSVMYAEGKPRIQTYNEMIDRILSCVRAGSLVCVACYGHPGVFCYPAHESVRQARAEGYDARMLPGISSEDCLFADLGIDPAIYGCQSYEATDFLANGRHIDPTSSVVLWQIGVVGDSTFKSAGYDLSAFPLLIERLLQYYPATHVGYLYEAATLPGCTPIVWPVQLVNLGQMALTAGFTLYIPPAYPTAGDPVIWGKMEALRMQNLAVNPR